MATLNHIHIFSLITLLLSVFCFFSKEAMADQGTATFYTPPYVPSACYGYSSEGVMIAAASAEIWDNKAACGRNYRVKCLSGTNQGVPHPCNGNTVVVKIVDYCPPPGCKGTIDLSREAFSSIANTDAGKINISFERV